MLTKLRNGEVYSRRYPGIVPINVALDREAALILEALAPHKRARGQLIARLLHDYQARIEERGRMRRDAESPAPMVSEGI